MSQSPSRYVRVARRYLDDGQCAKAVAYLKRAPREDEYARRMLNSLRRSRRVQLDTFVAYLERRGFTVTTSTKISASMVYNRKPNNLPALVLFIIGIMAVSMWVSDYDNNIACIGGVLMFLSAGFIFTAPQTVLGRRLDLTATERGIRIESDDVQQWNGIYQRPEDILL